MSFNVLVVPEDPTYNGYLLKPLCKRLLAEAGKPSANIVVLPEPRVRGFAHAKKLLAEQIFREWRHFQLILFIPDADGAMQSRRDEFLRLELLAAQEPRPVKLLCCAAEQELETWLLAGHPEKLKTFGWTWQVVRAEISVKERYFQPFLEQHGTPGSPSEGRDRLMEAALGNFDGMKRRCPELQDLEDRIREFLSGLA